MNASISTEALCLKCASLYNWIWLFINLITLRLVVQVFLYLTYLRSISHFSKSVNNKKSTDKPQYILSLYKETNTYWWIKHLFIRRKESISYYEKNLRKMENKSTKRGRRWKESVCLLPKERKGRRKERKIECGHKSYIKWDSDWKKIKINSSTPCALYMLTEGLLQTAGSPSNVL